MLKLLFIVGIIILCVSIKADFDVDFLEINKNPSENEVRIRGTLEVDSSSKILWAEIGIYFLDENGEIFQGESIIIQGNKTYNFDQTYKFYHFKEARKIAADVIDYELDNKGSLVVSIIIIAVGALWLGLLILYKIIKIKRRKNYEKIH